MIGVDLVHVKRIEKFYEKFGRKAYERFLSNDEIALVKNPQSAAGFWAAKEAVSKALGCGISEVCTFKDIRIHKDEKGKPRLTLSSHIIKTFDVTDISLSISHDNDFAIAVVAIESQNRQKILSH